jgi:GT2 family glycosyltransferase
MSRTPVDVVIPVYNAPRLTRRCVESLLAHLGPRLGDVHLQDDASDPPTAQMLDLLEDPRLRVHHAPRNQGFPRSVNEAFTRTRSEFVLVLNSDTEARDDFLSPLIEALMADSRLAAVTPAGRQFRSYDLDRYARRNGLVVTHNLAGYAFLMRRNAWEEVGGFDSRFGRGYYEDSDLSRRLLERGWWLGVHPGAKIGHTIAGSFNTLPDRYELMGQNRDVYYELHPGAKRQVVLISGAQPFAALPSKLKDEAEEVLRGGGNVLWLTPRVPRDMPALDMRSYRPTVRRCLKLRDRGTTRKQKRVKELWIAPGASRLRVRMLHFLFQTHEVAVTTWS